MRIGALTEVSGEPGENTSDMWLWSLNTATVGVLPAMTSWSFTVSINEPMVAGSSSAYARKKEILAALRPGRADRSN